MQQVGFWRAQLEVLLVTLALSLLVHALTWISPPPWAEILSIGSLGVYIGAAWRLAPGTGSTLRRILRVLAWAVVCALSGGVAAWLLSKNIAYGRTFLGVEPGTLRIPFGQIILSSLLITLPLVGFGRAIRNIREATRTRLRWQLTYGFLVVSVVTALVVYLAIGVYLSIYSVATESPMIDPQSAAERLSASLAPLVEQADPAALQASLQTIIDGTARIPTALDTSGKPELRSLVGLQRLLVITPDGDGGRVIAAAGAQAPTVGKLAGSDLARFRIPLVQAYQQNRCVVTQPITGSIPDSAICPIGTSGTFLVVETLAALESAQFGAMIGRTVALAAASLAIALGGLLLSSVIVLLVSGVLGYLLARRTTKRIEQVADATTALASGERHIVADQRSDEIGQLAAAFNQMADQLAEREAALKVARDHAEELLAANRRMVANISHELRTPLATLRGYLEALQHSHGNQLPSRDMEVIHAETERLTSLIDDLFTLTRAEARQLPLQLTSVDLYALISRLAETIAPLARRQRSLELVTSLSAHLPLVLADTTRLEQILLNLIQNALRHTPPGGIIAIDAIAMPPMLAISVSDTGEGIAAEDLPFVFERFYRGDSSRSRETGGAGLGLALVRELTEAMGGSVSVESTPGRGSRFTVRLLSSWGTEVLDVSGL